MRKITSLSFILAAGLCFAVGATAADAPKLACPVSGKEAYKAHSVDYKEGHVYFCCDNCPKEFAKNKEKYAAKANVQLVTTKQYRQKVCPLTGKKFNKEKFVQVGGIKVRLCCDNCKEAIEKLETDEAKLEKVFSDASFEKGFKLNPKKDKQEKP